MIDFGPLTTMLQRSKPKSKQNLTWETAMTMQHTLTIFLFLGLFEINAYSAQVEFGPFVGSGKSSDQSTVRYVNGLQLTAIGPGYEVSKSLTIEPLITIENGFANLRLERGAEVQILDYDQRSLILGTSISKSFSVYDYPLFAIARFAYGRSRAKLGIDRTAADYFTQELIHNIDGETFRTELGTGIKLQEGLLLQLVMMGSIHRFDQADSLGTSITEQEDPTNKSLSLTSRVIRPEDNGVGDTLYLKTVTAAVRLKLDL